MNNLVKPLFSEAFIQTLCWTLLHSLWIGLLTAGLAGFVVICTPKATARLRYQLLCATLLVFVGLTGFCLYQEAFTRYSGHSVNAIPAASGRFASFLRANVEAGNSAFSVQFVEWINRESGWLLALWFVLFLGKSLQLVGGLCHAQRIRTHGVYSLPDEWTDKVRTFSRLLGIRQPVLVRQSAFVPVPVLVGTLRPVILLPVGLIFQLPMEQLDAILWHELAHVRRRDYLINLLQNLLETVFFFNPGLLWVSSLLREEREACCDELVLAYAPSRRDYVDALLVFQSLPRFSAVALGLGSHPLVDRLRRIVTAENKRLSWPEQAALLISFLILSVLWVVSQRSPVVSSAQAPVKANRVMTPPVAIKRPEAIPQPQKRLSATRLTASGGQPRADTSSLPVAKAAPPDSTQWQFISIRFVNNNHDRANREMLVRDEQDNRYQLRVTDSQIVALSINDVAVPESDLQRYHSLLEQIERTFAEKQRQKQEAILARNTQAALERQQQEQQQEGQRRKEDFLRASQADPVNQSRD